MALGGGNGDSAEGASAGTRSYFPLASSDDVESFQSNGAPVSDRRQRATTFASALNVCKNCIGSAVLTLPFAFRQSGLAAGLVQLAIVHVGSAAGFHFIAEATILEGADFQPLDLKDADIPLGEAIMEWVEVPDNSPITGKTLQQAQVGERTGATIAAIQRNDETIAGPGAETTPKSGDILVAIGSRAAQHALQSLLETGQIDDGE
jgi:hypothetical protein